MQNPKGQGQRRPTKSGEPEPANPLTQMFLAPLLPSSLNRIKSDAKPLILGLSAHKSYVM